MRRNLKKIRRRGLVSGVHLDLPPSPIPTPSPPQTSITFTAEWDWTQKSFVFTPFDTTCPLAPTTTHFSRDTVTIPENVEDDYFSHSPALSTPSVYSVSISSPYHPSLSAIDIEWVGKGTSSSVTSGSSLSPDSSHSSPCTPVSEIFDNDSFYSHSRKSSQSTVASSVDDLSGSFSEDEAKKDALDEFIDELSSSTVPTAIDDQILDSIISRRPRDLLLQPLSMYDQTLYRSPEIKPLAIRRPASASPISKPSRGRRPLPDAPISAKSTLSIYSPDVRICTLQPHQSTEALISCRRRAVSRLCLLWSLRGQQEAILCVNSFRCRFAKPSSATGLSLNHRMIEMLVSRTLVLRPIS